jgi:hypothetical protein
MVPTCPGTVPERTRMVPKWSHNVAGTIPKRSQTDQFRAIFWIFFWIFRNLFFEREFQQKKNRGQKISFPRCSSPSVYEPFAYVSDRIRTILRGFFGSAPICPIWPNLAQFSSFFLRNCHFSDPESMDKRGKPYKALVTKRGKPDRSDSRNIQAIQVSSAE